MKIIAELGLNTNGDLDTALRMVEACAEAGCDGVKVQAFFTSDFLPHGHPDWGMFEAGRLSFRDIKVVADECRTHNLLFGGTPTSLQGVRFLHEECGADWLKNGSDYLLRHDMIHAMLDTGLETWVATGMGAEDEVAAVPREANLMACTSAYPCPPEEAHLSKLRGMVNGRKVRGYSDHTVGTTAAVMAVTLGAAMWEGHVTLDHALPGPDHSFSRDPVELAGVVGEVRRAEKMFGWAAFIPTESELVNRDVWRVTEGAVRK